MFPKILIISKEEAVTQQLVQMLQDQQCSIECKATYKDGLHHLVAVEETELTILQLHPPWEESIDVLYPIHYVSNTAVVVLLSPQDKEAKTNFRDLADDWIWLPMTSDGISVIKKRIDARRQSPTEELQKPAFFYYRGLLVPSFQNRVFVYENEVFPSRTQYDILAFFIRHRGSVVTRDQILDEVWHPSFVGDARVVDEHICELRKMFDVYSKEDYIETIRGFGYCFCSGIQRGGTEKAV